MLKAKYIYLKEKQVFVKENNILRFLGKPIDIAKQWKKEGMELLHIVDLDALKGLKSNFDVYDKLTYLMHVEVECGENEEFIEQLLKINARVVISLPTKIDLNKFAKKQKLIVGKVSSDYSGVIEDIENVNDILLENATLEAVKKYHKMKKRILVYKKDYNEKMQEMIFALLDGL